MFLENYGMDISYGKCWSGLELINSWTVCKIIVKKIDFILSLGPPGEQGIQGIRGSSGEVGQQGERGEVFHLKEYF